MESCLWASKMHATCNEQEERWRAGCMNRESVKTMSRNERQQQSVGAFVKFTSRQTTSPCCEQITTLVEFQVIQTAEGLGLIYLSCRKSSHTGYTFDLCDRCLLCGRCHFRQHFRSGMKLVYQLSSMGTIHVLTGNTLGDPNLCKRSVHLPAGSQMLGLPSKARPAMVPAQV